MLARIHSLWALVYNKSTALTIQSISVDLPNIFFVVIWSGTAFQIELIVEFLVQIICPISFVEFSSSNFNKAYENEAISDASENDDMDLHEFCRRFHQQKTNSSIFYLRLHYIWVSAVCCSDEFGLFHKVFVNWYGTVFVYDISNYGLCFIGVCVPSCLSFTPSDPLSIWKPNNNLQCK